MVWTVTKSLGAHGEVPPLSARKLRERTDSLGPRDSETTQGRCSWRTDSDWVNGQWGPPVSVHRWRVGALMGRTE
jgi:hypothetical protein